jgi:hypothetical protein
VEETVIVPTSAPSWPEFSASAANGTYMLTANFAVSGTLNLNANVTIIFAGGRFTGSGTINGNKTIFVAPPVQVFDNTINFSGTWNLEKVYDTGNASVINSHFLNFRVPSGYNYNCILGSGNELTFVNIQKSGIFSGSGSGTSFTFQLVTKNSPFPAKPIVIVNTNQKVPFKVTTTNTSGGTSNLVVEFNNSVSSPVIYYTLTGYYYS